MSDRVMDAVVLVGQVLVVAGLFLIIGGLIAWAS